MTYSCSGRPNAIEHVCTKSDGDHDVFWVANTHDIAWLAFREKIGAHIDTATVIKKFGFRWRTDAYTLQKSAFASPPDRPPIAMPGVSRFTISREHSRLNARSRPPWIMQKRFCLLGYL